MKEPLGSVLKVQLGTSQNVLRAWYAEFICRLHHKTTGFRDRRDPHCDSEDTHCKNTNT